MTTPSKYAQACLDRLIPQLTGLTIIGGAVDESGEYWGFVARGMQGGRMIEKTILVLADPEGNGPGFLDISEEDPEPPASAASCECVRETLESEHAVAGAPRFALGQVVATPGALAALQENEISGAQLLHRHVRGDWGDLCEEDRQANAEALEQGLRILSAYRLEDGSRLWVITEADRSATTLLLPSEY